MANNPYNSDNDIFSKVMGTAMLGGAGYAAYKGITDAEGFKDSMTRVVNAVMPVKSGSTGSIKKDQLNDARSRMLAMEIHSSERNKVNNQWKSSSTAEKMGKATWEKFNIDPTELDSGISSLGKEFRFTSLKDVKDAGGNEIGEQFIKKLDSLGLKVKGKPVFEGTTGVFTVVEDGRERTIRIPFAAQDPKTTAWVAKGKDAEYVAHLRATPTKHPNGGIKLSVRDHNTALLEMLSDKERIAIQATSDREGLMRDLKHLSLGKIKDVEKIKMIVDAKSTHLIMENMSTSRMLQRALKSDWLTEQNWVVATSDYQKSFLSGQVKMDRWGLIELNNSMPGAGSSFIGAKAAAQEAGSVSVSGTTFKEIMSYPKHLKGDSSRFEFVINGKAYNMNNINEVKDANTRRLIEKASAGHFGFTMGQEQTAQFTGVIRDSMFAQQVEREKSEKGLFYMSEELGTRPLNGISKGRIQAFRNTPMFLDKDLASVPEEQLTGYQRSLKQLYTGKKKGMVNLLGMVNPVGKEEYLGIASDVYKDMKAFQPIQWSVQELATHGLDDRSMIEIELQEDAGRQVVKQKRLSEIFTDAELRERMKKAKDLKIKIGSNNILGKAATGGEVYDHQSLYDTLQKEGDNLLTRGASIHMNKQDFERTLAENASTRIMADGSVAPRDPNAPMKFFGQIEGRASKAAIFGERARGSVYGRIESEAIGMAKMAGIQAGMEFTAHKEMFSKILPQAFKDGKFVMQKGAPELLQHLQLSMAGHLLAYNQEAVELSGDIASRFRGYLGYTDVKTKALNLTESVVSGTMQWLQNTANDEAFSQQIYDTASVLGAMKAHTAKYGGKLTLDDTFDAAKGATELTEAWNRATGSRAEELFKKVHAGEKIATEEARSHIWNLAAGIMPEEIPAMTQGAGFNTMNVSFRDMHFFMDKTGMLSEMAYQNTTNSTKLTQEMMLMEQSLEGSPQFIKSMRAYEEKIGQKIKTYGMEEINEMLGGFGGSTFLSDLKHPNAFKGTFLNKDVNPYGFKIHAGDKELYIGSGELFSKSYYLPSTGKVTINDFAMDTAKLLNNMHTRGGIRESDLQTYMKGFAEETVSSKSGLLDAAKMRVDYASYSKHVVDKRLLHNDYLNLESPFGKEVSHLLGNTAKISSEDYQKMVAQQLSDNLRVAKEHNRSLVEQLEIGFGKDNFFTKYQAVNSLNEVSDVKAVAESITKHQVGLTSELSAEIKRLSATGGSEEQVAKIRKIMNEETMAGLFVRYPSIVGSSYSTATVLADASMEAKTISTGKMATKNILGDFDGDALMFKGMFSKAARLESNKLIDQTQRHTAAVIDSFKSGGALKFLREETERTTATLTKELAGRLSSEILHEAPIDTALAAFYTKSLTGALNIKAQGVKGYMDDLVANKGLSETELSKIYAFFSTIPSLATEQKAISSKQAERILGLDGSLSSMDNVTNLIGSIKSDKMLESIKAMEGDVHPMIMTALAGSGHKTQFAEEHVNLIKGIVDANMNIRTIRDDEFRNIYQFFNSSTQDMEARLAKYKEFTLENTPLLETEAGRKLGLKEGTGFIDIYRDAMNSPKGRASESIEGFLSRVISAHKSGKAGATGEALLQEIFNGDNHFLHRSKEILTPEAFTEKSAGFLNGRTIKGWEEVKKLGRWLTEEGKVGGRMGGLGAAVLGGFTALNLLSGDGTPESPNDLPSVNNPSFAHNRSNPMLSRRTMSPDINYNSNMNLLTDNKTPHSIMTGAIQNMFGSASVSVSDGTNPYLSDMYNYSNN